MEIMIEKLQVYKCGVCGNIVEVLHQGKGELVCCGKPMVQQVEKSQDAGNEKHVPVAEKKRNSVAVKVGEVAHPMDENHYIEWVELIANDGVSRVFLKPGSAPEAEFEGSFEEIKTREYCSIHGLWKG